jgi:hypothetical protein
MGGRDRDRERGRDREPASSAAASRDDLNKLREDIDSARAKIKNVGQQLERTSKLALQASKDAGEARAQLQVVFFVTGIVREALLTVISKYEEGRERVRQTGEKGAPLKVLIYQALVAHAFQVACQEHEGTDVQTKAAELRNYEAEYDVLSVNNALRPPEGADKAWVLVVNFSGSERSRKMREMWLSKELAPLFHKRRGVYPPLGVRASAWKAGSLHMSVASDHGLAVKGKGAGKTGAGGPVKRASESPSHDAKQPRR